MARRQFRVLSRDFLFSIVDRDLLSIYARGDASQLLLQLVALLVFVGICCSLSALTINASTPPLVRLVFAFGIEHFLIATTMLVVGIFAVLSWNTMFPGHSDVLVLGPLPIRAHTILLAKVAAMAVALGLTVVALHGVSGLVWPFAFSASGLRPTATGGPPGWIRLLGAYWVTMFAAGTFVFSLALAAQGIAATLLPRRYFLRLSSVLQLGAFCAIVGGYLFQPIGHPSYWFLALFLELIGSPAPLLAGRAVLSLTGAVAVAGIVYGLSYVRMLRQIAQEPDIAPTTRRVRWLPTFGDAWQTAVAQFSVRTLWRSAPHRVILAFYWGLGCAFTLVFLRTPRGRQLAAIASTGDWRETSVPVIVSSVLMTASAVVAARLAFAMPKDLPAHWIFRLLPAARGSCYVSARRRAFLLVSALPGCLASAAVLLSMWPWPPAVEHLAALALLSVVLVEIALGGEERIPFTCAYRPGRSRVHIAICVAIVIVLPATIWAATLERDALESPVLFGAILAVLGLVWIGARS